MKVIDLLNKIANGEKTPNRIKYNYKLYYWCYSCKTYERIENGIRKYLYNDLDNLNDEVETIEDTPKEDKKILEKLNISNFPRHNNSLKKTAIKLNEVIDYLESKGE